MNHPQARHELLEAARELSRGGLGASLSKSGNVSVRVEGGFLITPTGVSYGGMRVEDLVELEAQGTTLRDQLQPSSEWRFHKDIYLSRPEIGAVVHAHSQFATALACLRRAIPAFHYMVAVAGGDSIRCAEYATFGTPELSRNALVALEDRRACLLANHGLIAAGATLSKALHLAVEVETLAAQYCTALRLGEPVVLDAREMAEVLRKFETYGQQVSRPGER